MGQPCSTTKTNKKKHSAMLEQTTNLSTSPVAKKSNLIIAKKVPRYNVLKQLQVQNNLEKKSVIRWKKNHQTSQRIKYTESRAKEGIEGENSKAGLLSIAKNPFAFRFLKQVSLILKRQGEILDLNLLGNTLKEQKAVEKLELSFRRWLNINNEAFIHLFSGLKKLVHLKYLEVDLKGCLSPVNMNGVIEELSRCIKRFLELGALRLNLSHNSSFSDEELITLGKSMERLRKLKSVSVTGNRLSRISKEGLERFGSSLKKIKALTELELSFNGGWMIDSQGFYELSRSIGRIQGLEKLVLSFDECARLVQDKVLESLGSVLRNLERLNVLKVHAGRCVRQLTNGKNFQNFLKRLNKLTALTNIYIDLRRSCNQWSSHWLRDEYEKYKSHRFFLANDLQVTREEIEAIGEFLKENQVITSIALDFERCQAVNDMGLELLAKGLTENLRISDIAFDFSRCGEITNKGLTHFGKCLNPLALRSVKLIFNEAFRVTNEGVMSFGHEILGLVHLKCLHLDFSWCWQICSKGLESIVETVKNYTSLEDFSLNLSRYGEGILSSC